MDKFSTNLRELRKEKGLKQREVANFANVPYSSYCKWEQGLREPTHHYLINLANFYQVSTDFLLGRTDDLGNVIVNISPELALTKNERTLLAQFKKLTDIEKNLILKQIFALSGNK